MFEGRVQGVLGRLFLDLSLHPGSLLQRRSAHANGLRRTELVTARTELPTSPEVSPRCTHGLRTVQEGTKRPCSNLHTVENCEHLIIFYFRTMGRSSSHIHFEVAPALLSRALKKQWE